MQLELRQSEHDALVRLLAYVQLPASDKGGLHHPSNAVYAAPEVTATDLTRHQVSGYDLKKDLLLSQTAVGVLAQDNTMPACASNPHLENFATQAMKRLLLPCRDGAKTAFGRGREPGIYL